MFVPVVDKNQNPLMPTTPSRARRWIREGKATPFWKRGIFCVRLNVEPSDDKKQEIAVGIDPGTKREAFTVKSEAHTFLNIQANSVDWVSEAVYIRRWLRQNRRKKAPNRKMRRNRSATRLTPSARARWGLKLRVCNWLSQMFPLTVFIVEDVHAKSRGMRRWDFYFSAIEIGKNWFYRELEKIAVVIPFLAGGTRALRTTTGLKKSSAKLEDKFEAHCLDSWVLANCFTGGHVTPENTSLLRLIPLRFHRRQLHRIQPAKGGERMRYGGTRSLGFKRGSIVKHLKRGITYVGGYLNGRISLHSLETGKRITQSARPEHVKHLTYNSWRVYAV